MKNFFAVGSQPIEILFNKSRSTAVVGTNGASKSSCLIDSLNFALFGKPFRNINIPNVINSINRSECLVELDFLVSSEQYKIVRGLKPKIFEIYKNGELIDQDSHTKEYQKYLEETILGGLNEQVFKQIVVLGSADYRPFMQLTAQSRREVIEELLDIKIFSQMQVLVKDRISIVKEDLKNLDIKIDMLDQNVQINKSHNEVQKQGKDKKIIEIDEKISNVINTLESIKTSISKNMGGRAVLSQKLAKDADIRKNRKKLDAIRYKLEHAKEDSTEIISFVKTNENCPSCLQNIPHEHKVVVEETQVKRIEDIDKNLTKYTEDIANHDKLIATFEKINKNIIKLDNDIYGLNIQLAETTKFLENLKQQREDLNKDDNVIDMSALLAEFDLYKADRIKKLEDKQYYDVIVDMLKDGGMKSRVIRQFLPQMNTIINKYLDKFGSPIQFTLDEQFNEIVKSRYRDTFQYNCLPAYSKIITEDGIKSIKWIVDTKYSGNVKSIDNDGRFVWNKVVNHWSKKNIDKKWVRIKLDGGVSRGTKSELVCTDDHKILVAKTPLDSELVYMEAKNSIGYWSVRDVSFRDITVYSADQISFLVGSLLGDASITKSGQGRISHKSSHLEYVKFKQNIFGGTISEKIATSFGKLYPISTLTLPNNSSTKYLRELMYLPSINGTFKKSVKNILDLIDERSLALWYMDDGHSPQPKKTTYNRYVQLCTDGFSLEDCKLLTQLLKDKWNIDSDIRYCRKIYPRIVLNCENSDKFFSLIHKYIVPCMQYKLPEKYKNRFVLSDYKLHNKVYSLSKIKDIKYLKYDWNKSSTRKYSSRLYDIEVDKTHNFIAENTVVHNCFSEGEKQRIDLALMLTWREIAKGKNTVNTNLLIFDEIFDKSLDNSATEALLNILTDMDKNTNIFVISHKNNLEDKLRSVLKFEKINNFATIV